MAKSLDGLEILTRTVINAAPAKRDVGIFDIPWRRLEEPPSKLRVGVLPEDKLYPLHPPVKRALEKAVEVLQYHGHELIPITPEEARISDASEVAWELMALDPTKTVIRHITDSCEPMVPSVSTREPPANFGNFQFVQGLTGLDPILRCAAATLKREELQEAWMRKIWVDKKLDVVIGVPAKSTAVPHDTFGWPVYTVLQNVLDVSTTFWM